MSSLREQIILRVIAALTAAAPVGSNVYRSREVSLTRILEPAIMVAPHGTSVTRIATGVDRHQMDMAVEVFVRGDPWVALTDPVDIAAHAVMMTDASLWTLAQDIRRISEAYESMEADRTAGTLTVTYRITYLTSAHDITRAA